jgi:hypothetical protein
MVETAVPYLLYVVLVTAGDRAIDLLPVEAVNNGAVEVPAFRGNVL